MESSRETELQRMLRVCIPRIALLILPLLVGCGGELVRVGSDDLVFFRISGVVEARPDALGAEPGGAVAWIWEESGRSHGFVQRVGLEPRVFRYILDVPRPPTQADLPTPDAPGAPFVGVPGISVVVGLPILYAPAIDDDDSTGLEVDASVVGDWLRGTLLDATILVRPTAQSDARLLSATIDHLLIGSTATPSVDQLAQHPDFGATLSCGLDQVIAGLTLYRRPLLPCAPWEALATAGERTEFQGVAMYDPKPASP